MNKAQISDKLAHHGHRATPSRLAVIDALLSYHGHMTADDLYAKMKEGGSNVGRMTVFRTLDVLAEIGVVRPTYGGSGAAQFVILEDGHHLNNAYAIGLATGFIPSGALGGEKSFQGQTNGLWYYQNLIAQIILTQLVNAVTHPLS